jgi:hypothetical protein
MKIHLITAVIETFAGAITERYGAGYEPVWKKFCAPRIVNH